jgi:hypothetical protein
MMWLLWLASVSACDMCSEQFCSFFGLATQKSRPSSSGRVPCSGPPSGSLPCPASYSRQPVATATAPRRKRHSRSRPPAQQTQARRHRRSLLQHPQIQPTETETQQQPTKLMSGCRRCDAVLSTTHIPTRRYSHRMSSWRAVRGCGLLLLVGLCCCLSVSGG